MQKNMANNFDLDMQRSHNMVCILNRKKHEGRWLRNVPEILDWLATKYKISANVFYLSRKQSLQQQASMLRPCRVLISPHGAGNTNWFFLRSGTTIVEVVHYNAGDAAGYFGLFAATLPGVTYLRFQADFKHSDMKERACYKTHKLHKDPQMRRDFAVLTPDECDNFMACYGCAKESSMDLPVEFLEKQLGGALSASKEDIRYWQTPTVVD